MIIRPPISTARYLDMMINLEPFIYVVSLVNLHSTGVETYTGRLLAEQPANKSQEHNKFIVGLDTD